MTQIGDRVYGLASSGLEVLGTVVHGPSAWAHDRGLVWVHPDTWPTGSSTAYRVVRPTENDILETWMTL